MAKFDIDAEVAKLAGLQIDLLHKIRNNNITFEEFEQFLNMSKDDRQKVSSLLSGELTVSEPDRKWREKDGIIYFSVTSNGKTGEQWVEYFTAKGVKISDWAKQLLLSADFKNSITNNIKTEVAVLKGMMWNDNNRTTKKIRAKANDKNLFNLSPEVACLIRDKFTNQELKDMKLYWIVTMHNPIEDSDGLPSLLSVGRSGDEPWLDTSYGKPDGSWYVGNGFTFGLSQEVLVA